MSFFNGDLIKKVFIFLLLGLFFLAGSIFWERHLLNIAFKKIKEGDTFEMVEKVMGKPNVVGDYEKFKNGKSIKLGKQYSYNSPSLGIEVFVINFDVEGRVISKDREESP
jgi:hypothetical protein